MDWQFLDHLALGFGVAFQWVNLLYCLIGVLLGTLIGVLPGIGPTATIAMLLPVTFGLSPITAMIIRMSMPVSRATPRWSARVPGTQCACRMVFLSGSLADIAMLLI